MKYAEKIELLGKDYTIGIGKKFNGFEIDKIEVYCNEYEDHTELIILFYSGMKEIGKIWNYPMVITYVV